MDTMRLKSKVSIDEREFLVQTVHDSNESAVISSLFVDGQILEISKYPYAATITEDELARIIKTTHSDKKSELERLLESHKEVLKSGDADLMFSVGTGLFYKRLYHEARALFESVISCKPDHHQAGNYLGLAHFALGNFDQAAKVIGRAVELRPKFADYHNNYGEALLESGFCRRAVEEFQEALKLNIYYADAYFNLGIAYMVNALTREDYKMYSEQANKALEIMERAILISPEFKTARFEEASKLYEQGELEGAISLFKAVRNNKRTKSRLEFSNHHVRYLLFSELANERAVADRIRFLREEIERNPNYADLHYELGLCYYQQAHFNWRTGIDHLQKAADLNPRLSKAEKGIVCGKDFSESMREAILSIARDEVD